MSLPRMSWHIGDYKRDTGHLRTVEHGAYFLLIMHYWARGALPNDDGQLARIACLTDREWKAVRPTLAGLFQPGWRHGRVDEELAAAQTKYERLSAAGKKGGRPRNEKPSESPAFETLKPNESEAESDREANAKQPITDNPKEEERPSLRSGRPRGARLPADWAVSNADACFALPLIGEHRMAEEAAKFKDYWAAQPGQRGVKVDWPATWRNWIRRSCEQRGNGNGANRQGGLSGAVDELRAFIEREEIGHERGGRKGGPGSDWVLPEG